MLTLGTKIRQKKENPRFSFGNSELVVTKIFEDGTIMVQSSDHEYWIGIMHYRDVERYFDIIKDEPPKRKWGKWAWSFSNQCWFCTNGKTVKAKYGDYIGKASCSPEDKFDLRLGISIAFARAERKCKRHILLEAIRTHEQAMKDYEIASEYVHWLIS